ncbi:MAG: hypothetical protein AAGF46_12030 [Pseudomonadota bacterium]
MYPTSLKLRGPQTARLNAHYQKPLGQVLVDKGVVDHEILLHALSVSQRVGAPLEQVLLAEGHASETDILEAQADRFAAIPLSLNDAPPDRDCCSLLDPLFCLEHKIWPWIRLGNTLVIATSAPDDFEDVADKIPEELGTILMGVARARDIETAIAKTHGEEFAHQAENDVPEALSCRNLHVLASRRQMLTFGAMATLLAAAIIIDSRVFFGLLAVWAVISLVAVALMKSAALLARILLPVPSSPAPHGL